MTISRDPAYLVFDVEAVPDGELLRRVRYPSESFSPAEAIERARGEVLAESDGRSDFVPTSFLYPVAICVARVTADFRLQAITCLDDPDFRPREMTAAFWRGLAHYQARLVSFHGRGFNLPLLEWAAFRFGLTARGHFDDRFGRRYRYGNSHLDLNDWLSNHGACPIAGGLDLLSKLLGKPGKLRPPAHDVWRLIAAGDARIVNDYCMFDVLDTYFVFLRTRVMTGELDLPTEQERVREARDWIAEKIVRQPHLQMYLDNWGDWHAWL